MFSAWILLAKDVKASARIARNGERTCVAANWRSPLKTVKALE
jgi:hypothetical protein